MPYVHIPNNLVQTTATGDPSIDGLLWGWHWGETFWGYSFPTDPAEYLNPNPFNYNGYLGYAYESIGGFQQFNSLQQQQIISAVSNIETFLPVEFVSNAVLGQSAPVVFRFAIADSIDYGYGFNGIGQPYDPHGPGGGRSAEAAVPDPFQMNWRATGDTWYIANAYDVPVPGSFPNAAGLLHEFGHALGLKHGHGEQPVFNMTNVITDQFGNVFAEPAFVGTAPKLPDPLDTQEFSIMTYRVYEGDDPFDFVAPDLPSNMVDYPWTFMMLDIAALQYLYGANFSDGSNPGDTVYSFNPVTGAMTTVDTVDGTETTSDSLRGRIFLTVWDGDGNDTFDFRNYADDMEINLLPGAFSTFSQMQVARLADGVLAKGNVANPLLYNGDIRSLIENVETGNGNDSIVGNQADNIIKSGGGDDEITGSSGSDEIFGGTGFDRVVYASGRNDNAVDLSAGNTVTVTRQDGTDTLKEIEKIVFDDGSLIFDVVSANLGFGYRVYQAAFGRTPDEGGLRFWVDVLDTLDSWGYSTYQKQQYVAREFNESQEFQSLYGANPSHFDYIDAMYQNVLFRLPDQAGYDFWVGGMDQGLTEEDILIAFSESVENKSNNAANLDDGVWVV